MNKLRITPEEHKLIIYFEKLVVKKFNDIQSEKEFDIFINFVKDLLNFVLDTSFVYIAQSNIPRDWGHFQCKNIQIKVTRWNIIVKFVDKKYNDTIKFRQFMQIYKIDKYTNSENLVERLEQAIMRLI